jgi:hypothetical protein
MNVVENRSSFGEAMIAIINYQGWLTEHLGERITSDAIRGSDPKLCRDAWLAFVADYEQVAGPTDANHTLSYLQKIVGPSYVMWISTRYISTLSNTHSGFYRTVGESRLFVVFDDVTMAIQFKLQMK